MEKKISKLTIERIALYLRFLDDLKKRGTPVVYSHEIAKNIGVTPATVRHDLFLFGQFGKVAGGYNVEELIGNIKKILGTQTLQKVALLGIGNLGKALLNYPGFVQRGFLITTIFDIDPQKIGQKFSDRECYHIDRLEEIIKKEKIKIAILTVPKEAAFSLAQKLSEIGIKGVLNFAPISLKANFNIPIEDVDLSVGLEKLSYFIKRKEKVKNESLGGEN